MSFQAIDTKLTDGQSVAKSDLFEGRSEWRVQDVLPQEDHPGSASRGIVVALLISLPFWALIGFTFFLLR